MHALILVLCCFLAFAEDTAPPSWTGNVNGFIGAKYLDHNDWEPVDVQGAFGVIFDTAPRAWPISLAVNTIFSGAHDDDVIDTDGSTSELQLGVKKIWNLPGLTRLFLAGGPDIVTAYTEIHTRSGHRDDRDTGVGLWLSSGAYWEIGRHINLGFMITASGAEVTLFNEDRNAGGLFIGILSGFHW
jgi:hypothetical protein